MNAALCISGQPRDLNLSLEQLRKNLLNCNKDWNFFVFCHCWYDDTLIGKPFDSAQTIQDKKLGYWQSNTCELIEYYLKPYDCLYEYPKNFDYFSFLTKNAEALQDKLASLFYSIYKANEIKKHHEKFIDFDLVIRTRFDLWIEKPIILGSFNQPEEYIYVPEAFQKHRMNEFNGSLTLTDILAISSSKNIDIFCEIYNNFEKLYYKLIAQNAKPYGENYLGEFVRNINKINVLPSKDLEVNFVRRALYNYF